MPVLTIILWYDFSQMLSRVDMSTPQKTKPLRGKYQLAKNIFVTCYLDVLEATDQEIRTFIGLKKRGDATVPIGTRIIFDAGVINRINVRRHGSLDIISIQVLKLEVMGGKPLHVCTAIQKGSRGDLREAERKEAEFPVFIEGKDAQFMASGGTTKGLSLHYTSKRAMLSLTLNRTYDFRVNYKGSDYIFQGVIKHIQYDWKNHEHLIGVHFPTLGPDEEIILNLLLDPEYTIDISGRQTVDTSVGKISALDDL
jgi:hypothetical protein